MTLPNSSETLSTGGIVATHTVSGKEYQTNMLADASGHLIGSRDDWLAHYIGVTNAANREVAELFNASAANIIRVRGIWLIPTLTSIAGAQMKYEINRTTTVGTTGSVVVTPRPLDTDAVALPAGITARYGSTAGVTIAYQYFEIYHFNEETNAATALVSYQNQLPTFGDRIAEIVLRPGQGVQVKQLVGAVGLTGAMMHFVVE